MSRIAIPFAALLLAACGALGTGGSEDLPAPDAELVASGAELYASWCASCHGEDLRGTGRGPSHLSRVYEPGHHSDAAFLLAVRTGVIQHHWSFGPMPPIDGLTDSDVESIVAFVRDVQRREGLEP